MEYSRIANEINESVTNLINQYRHLFTLDEYMTIKRLQLSLKKQVFNSFEELKREENKFLPYFARVWHHELTNLDEFHIGDNFSFIITCPTTSTEKNNFLRRSFISASLITDKHMGTFNKINYGILCSIDETNLLAISERDSHTITSVDHDDIAKKYFYTATTQEGDKLYSKRYTFSLRLPNEIETDMVKENILQNGDFIIQDKKAVYSDITLDTKTTKKLGVLLFEPFSERDYKEAHALAHKFNLKVSIIPKKMYFEKVSINKSRGQKHLYDISDIDTIEFILEHIEKIGHEYSNLIVNYFNYFVSIKDENQVDKLIINRQLEKVEIYLNGDNRFFQIDYANGHGNYLYSIDHVKVSRDEFQAELLALNPQNRIDMKP